MSATTGFKQQCPSCEMLVSIKDPKLIGRRVICPRCQFRFVVVNPEAETVENPAVRAGTSKMMKVDKPAVEQEVKSKSKPASPAKGSSKDKPGPKKGEAKQVAAEKKPRAGRKKLRLSKTVLIGGGLAGVAVISLIVGVLALSGFFGSQKRPTKPVARTPGNTASPPPAKDGKPGQTPVFTDELTKLIPLNAEVIFCLNGDMLLDTAELNNTAAFITPGAFHPARFSQHLGFAPTDLVRFIRAENHTQSWAYNIIQTRQPVASNGVLRKEVAEALHLKPARAPRGVGYYRVARENDVVRELSNLVRLITASPPLPVVQTRVDQGESSDGDKSGLGLFVKDDRTLIVADLEPLLKYLDGEAPTTPTPAFTSISQLQSVLDNPKARPIFCVAADTRKAGRVLRRMIDAMQLENPNEVRALLKQSSAVGVSVQSIRQTRLTGTLGVECRKDTDVPSVKRVLQDSAQQTKIVGWLAELLGFDPPALDRPLPVTHQGRSVFLQVSVSPADGGARMPAQLAGMMLRLKASVDVATRGGHLHELANALSSYVKANGGKFPMGALPRPAMPGIAELPWPASERLSWMVELLPYLPQFAECKSQFPFAGKAMPLLMQDKESWHHEGNFWASMVVIPQFLGYKAPENTWRVRHPRTHHEIAASHFVGMAGVGLDAAYYLPADARRGIFSYDRQTAIADIKSPEKTIALIQIPPDFKTPWLAGGGSTLRGVPEKNSVRPFVRMEEPFFTAASLTAACAGPMPQPLVFTALMEWDVVSHSLRPGTFAIMADGKVRFIPASISDETFKALCTVDNKGKASIDIDKIAPVVPRKAER